MGQSSGFLSCRGHNGSVVLIAWMRGQSQQESHLEDRLGQLCLPYHPFPVSPIWETGWDNSVFPLIPSLLAPSGPGTGVGKGGGSHGVQPSIRTIQIGLLK